MLKPIDKHTAALAVFIVLNLLFAISTFVLARSVIDQIDFYVFIAIILLYFLTAVFARNKVSILNSKYIYAENIFLYYLFPAIGIIVSIWIEIQFLHVLKRSSERME
jgi:hypothetical protein